MLHRLCGPPSIHLSFNLAAVLSPNRHRLRRGLPGYLILFAPHAFAPERQYLPRRPPSPPVFFRISTHFTATPGIPSPSAILQTDSLKCSPGVEPRYFTPYLSARLRALYAQLFRLTLAPSVLPRLLARSQPVLLLRVTSNLISSPLKVLYNPKAFFTHAAWLHQGSPHCAIFPTAASRRSPGRVSVPMWPVILSDRLEIVAQVSLYLTYQLIPSGHILKRKFPSLSPSGFYAVLAAVSSCCPPLQGSFPDTTHPSATRHQQKQAFAMLPFDLHVLSLPPAFNLSHDQTLHYLNSFELFLKLNPQSKDPHRLSVPYF